MTIRYDKELTGPINLTGAGYRVHVPANSPELDLEDEAERALVEAYEHVVYVGDTAPDDYDPDAEDDEDDKSVERAAAEAVRALDKADENLSSEVSEQYDVIEGFDS